MTNVLVPLLGTLLAAFFCVFLTLHERSVTASAAAEPNADTDDLSEASDLALPGPTSGEPGPRDRCRCGHTFDWHHSCPHDVCGCREFVHARAEAA